MGMLDTARAHFPDLAAYLLCLGCAPGCDAWGSGVALRSRHTGQASLQSAPGAGSRRGGRHRWRLGLRQVDGAGRFLSADRRPGRLRTRPMVGTALHFGIAVVHRGELRPVVPARRAWLRVVPGLGAGLRHLVVVRGAAHAPAPVARKHARLVVRARRRPVRLARGTRRSTACCWGWSTPRWIGSGWASSTTRTPSNARSRDPARAPCARWVGARRRAWRAGCFSAW